MNTINLGTNTDQPVGALILVDSWQPSWSAQKADFWIPYYELQLASGTKTAGRYFTTPYQLSKCKRYLGVQECVVAQGPADIDQLNMQLVLVDLAAQQESVISKIAFGFIEPQCFEGDLIVYHKRKQHQSLVKEYDVAISRISNWHTISGIDQAWLSHGPPGRTTTPPPWVAPMLKEIP